MSANFVKFTIGIAAILFLWSFDAVGDTPDDNRSLVIYSGRSEELIEPLITKFREKVQFEVKVRYGKSAELAALIMEEGKRSPADVFFAQDAGALGALTKSNQLHVLPTRVTDRVDQRFRSRNRYWIGVSGRARVVVYNTKRLIESDLPESIYGFLDEKWQNRLGWAPTNGSFQAFVTAMRLIEGDQKTREWLVGIQANKPKIYPKNSPIVAAVGEGEIDVGFVNHYYLFRFLKDFGPDFSAKNYYLRDGRSGALINIAGVGILNSSKNPERAEEFIDFLLTPDAQNYFAKTTFEYPLIENVDLHPGLPSLDKIKTPDLDLSDLDDLNGTLRMLQELDIL